MKLENALQIQGFTNLSELTWLAQEASKRRDIVEIGSWKGRSTRAMADNTEGFVTAVDTWNGTPEDPHFKELQGKSPEWLFEEFILGVQLLNNVAYMRGTSREIAAIFASRGARFDMIFIDADHSYEAVRDDILAWKPLLAPGGLFCGHDYIAGRGGVVRAVDEFSPGARSAGVGTIWIAR